MPLPSIESVITVEATCDDCHRATTHRIAELSDGALIAICGGCATATLLVQE
jgi:NMD protein affecting ribosome stability and mRNA decay